ncbi:MAG: WD40 repeat domain-containing protein [Gemmataceae bacterium]
MPRLNLFGKSDNKLRPVWQSSVPDHTIGVAWSPDAKLLAAAAVSGPITIFDAATGKPAHQLKGHGFGTAAIAWQPLGHLLASVGQDKKVRLWDTHTGQDANALEAGASWAEKAVWHPSGQWLATAAGKKVRVWSAAGELVRELPAQAGTVMDMAWRPGTNHLTLLAYGATTTLTREQRRVGEVAGVEGFAGGPGVERMWFDPRGGQFDGSPGLRRGPRSRRCGATERRCRRELAWDHTSRYLATGGGPVVASGTRRRVHAGQRGPSRRCWRGTTRSRA